MYKDRRRARVGVYIVGSRAEEMKPADFSTRRNNEIGLCGCGTRGVVTVLHDAPSPTVLCVPRVSGAVVRGPLTLQYYNFVS